MDYSQFLSMHAELSLLAVILILFIADLFMCPDKKSGKGVYNTCLPAVLLLVHIVLNLLPCASCGTTESFTAFGGMYVHTPMMTVVKSILSVGTFIVFLMAHKWLSREENLVKQGEFYLLTLFTLLGMFFMISAGHFLMFFIGLELASVPMAAVVAFDKKRYESAEASAKFILLALFSAALMLYGMSLLYGATGTLYLEPMGQTLAANSWTPLTVAGLALIISGLGFKISLVPFHLWTADTYQGAPTSVTAYLSVISKGAAAFAAMVILVKVFGSMTEEWSKMLSILIVVTITIGNLFAIRQNQLKRFMAFSSISQAGYIMLAVLAGTPQGMASLVYYMVVYIVANLAVFGVIASVEHHTHGKLERTDYNGLYQTNPKLTMVMTLALFSLAGIPPFAGFFSKFFVFAAAFNSGHWLVVFIALVNTVISLYYYLLIIKAMFITPNEQPIPTFQNGSAMRVCLMACVAGILLLGIVSSVYGVLSDTAVSF